MSIIEFLRARYAEEEALAHEAGGDSWRLIANDPKSQHMVRHDPARVLADIEAKRALVAAYEHASDTAVAEARAGTAAEWYWVDREAALEEVIRPHAAVYSDHPDYRQEWKP